MIGLYVSVPIACFRKGMAREYLETEPLPPPATCYGFLLSLVGETDRKRHVGCRVAPVLLQACEGSVVLRTAWRQKHAGLGVPGNTRPDFQQLLTGVDLLIWLDSSEEESVPLLEDRVREALERPTAISRFGGLSLGESSHLVDQVQIWEVAREQVRHRRGRAYLLADEGRLTLPVWVDHVGSEKTKYAIGDLEEVDLDPPPRERLPVISMPPEMVRRRR